MVFHCFCLNITEVLKHLVSYRQFLNNFGQLWLAWTYISSSCLFLFGIFVTGLSKFQLFSKVNDDIVSAVFIYTILSLNFALFNYFLDHTCWWESESFYFLVETACNYLWFRVQYYFPDKIVFSFVSHSFLLFCYFMVYRYFAVFNQWGDSFSLATYWST